MNERPILKILDNRLLVLALALLVMAAGWLSYERLPVDAFPDVSPNLVQLFTVTEGLAPEEIEKYITFPVEASMNGLPGIERIRSVSNFGLSVVNVYFQDDIDIYFARQLVAERLQEARKQIPAGFGEPEMGPISTGMGLVLFYYLEDTTGRYSLTELRSMQDWLIKLNLQTVPGVTEVLGIGGWEKQYQVVVDPDSLLRYDLSMHQLAAALAANNLNVGAGFLEAGGEEMVVRSIGLATGIGDLERVVVATVDGTPVFLGDLAEIRIGGAVRRGVQTRNGTGEVVAGQVIKLFGANSSTVIAAVEEKVAELNRSLPEGVRIVPYYEQKSLVQAAVATVSEALLLGVLLVVAVLFLFLGDPRGSLVVALSIPFSVLFALIGMAQLGISANLMSFGGLAIAIGMMVDGTIVVVENVDRLLQRSPSTRRRGAIAAAVAEVARPIGFAIAIIIVVFLPLFTLQGVEGKTFRPLAYSVALAMLGSLLYTLLVAPALASLLMRGRGPEAPEEGTGGTTAGRRSFSERIVSWLERPYLPLLRRFVAHRRAAAALALVLLAAGALLVPRLGSEFTPQLSEGTMVLRLTMAPSIALTESTRVALRVERRLMEVPEVEGVVTRIGRGEVGAHTDPVNSAEMFLLLAPRDRWRTRSQEELEVLIRQHLDNIPGVLTSFTQPIEMAVDELLEGVQAELAVKIFGDDLDRLRSSAEEMAALLARVPGAADVQVDQLSGTPQLLLTVDRRTIARWGLDVEQVQQVVRAAVGGATAGQIFEGVRRYDILLRYPLRYRDDPEAIAAILVPTPDGQQVPLAQLVTSRRVVGPRQIKRENGQRFITVQCNVAGRDIGSFVAQAQREIARDLELPDGYLVSWGGQFRLQQEANRRLTVVVPITLLILLLALYAAFNSLRSSALILLNIPLALVGGVAALWLSGQSLSVPASVGFIALFGIALENGMVLVTTIEQQLQRLVRGAGDGLERGELVDRAARHGARLRLRPVLMTALTTACGLIPLLLAKGTGAEIQRPLATVVVGGLATSTMLTLLILPAIYRWFAPSAARERGDDGAPAEPGGPPP